MCALVGQDDKQTDGLLDGLHEAVALCRSWGAGNDVKGHRDFYTTECPGDELYQRIQRGDFARGKSSRDHGRKPLDKAPSSSSSDVPPFPLPRGWYFGPKSGPKYSVSGYYGHRDDLRTWQRRMAERGWSIGADGLYGPETRKVCKQFQAQKGLTVDGLVGDDTWRAAWTEPVT